MLTPTRSRSETTRGAVAPGTADCLTVVGAAGALDGGTAVVAGTAVATGGKVVDGADVVDASLPVSTRWAATTGRAASSARDPGAKTSTIHAIPATIDPSRTAYVEFNAIYCESAAVRTAA
jgi:hypothetical protein